MVYHRDKTSRFIGMTGIAGWSPVDGWHIYPPDHEMAGE